MKRLMGFLMMAAGLFGTDAEARHRGKMRGFSKTTYSSSCDASASQSCDVGASDSCDTAVSQSCDVGVNSSCDVFQTNQRYRQISRSSYTVKGNANLQSWAEEEARRMAALGTNGHTQPAPVGYFVGVGCNGQTCSRRGPPIAEATVKGKTVRVWKN